MTTSSLMKPINNASIKISNKRNLAVNFTFSPIFCFFVLYLICLKLSCGVICQLLPHHKTAKFLSKGKQTTKKKKIEG